MKARYIGRWAVDVHERAIHIQQVPDPTCPDCLGEGGWWATTAGRYTTEPVTCHCTSSLAHYRIPLWVRTRRQHTETEPF